MNANSKLLPKATTSAQMACLTRHVPPQAVVHLLSWISILTQQCFDSCGSSNNHQANVYC